MVKLGEKAIDFRLPGVDGKTYSLDDFRHARFLAIIFSCNHCPYVIASEDEFVEIQARYQKHGFQMVCINSNDDEMYPQDSFENMKFRAREKGFNFPYLRDQTQEVARAYQASRTPEIFLFDEERKLVYHGRINDNPREHDKITRHDLQEALNDLIEGRPVRVPETQPIGCSIKWTLRYQK